MFGTLRALVFMASFYTWTFLVCVLGLPFMVLPRRRIWWVGRAWGKGGLFLMRHIVGVRLEMRGLENVPDGPLLVASKHQSALETLALYAPFDDPTYILKQELVWVPVFGWWMWKFAQIPIARKKGRRTLDLIAEKGREAVAEGRQILIFPEGTRKAAGAPAQYKFGVVKLYTELGVPCLPVAINAGLFWPRRRLAFTPGVTVMSFLPPIAPGLGGDAFAARLETAIETESDRLLVEAAEAGVPIAGQAARRLEDLEAVRA